MSRVGFFTDTTLCIGCKACEVACKEWNDVPSEGEGFTGESYDNSGALGANRWRHVAFIEQRKSVGVADAAPDSLVQEAALQSLVEEAGMKGAYRGGAKVSGIHANFFVNTGGATAEDFLSLAAQVRESVRKQFGVCLEEEVRVVHG